MINTLPVYEHGLSSYSQDMWKRFYLLPDGTERHLEGDERSHYGIARTVKGTSIGDTEDAYEAMWNMGWIRIAESPDEVLAEIYRDGKPVSTPDLTSEQRTWLENKKYVEKKPVVYNSARFQSTREDAENAGKYTVVSRILGQRPA